MICIMSFSNCYPSLMNQTSAWSVLPCLVIWLEKAKFPLMNWMNIFQLLKKTDSLSTASLMGVEIQHEFVYPFEDAFVLYLSDYFDNSLFVIQGRHHPLSELHCIIYFHDCGNIEVDFHNHGNRSSCCRNPAALWYNYLYSDSNRSVMFTPNAIAIISS